MHLLIIVLISLIGLSYEREVKTLSISSANNHFALQLLQHLYNDNSNVFFSPFSISSAFGMLYLGSNSSTADELAQTLGYNYGHITRDEVIQQFETVFRQIADIDSNNYQLNVANKLVAQQDFTILEEYKDNLRKYFQTSIESADFKNNAEMVTNDINEWVKQQTHDMIPKLLSQPLDPSTALVILNAIYFKGIWQTKFANNQTIDEVFYNRGIDSLNTKMMKRNGKFNYTEIQSLDSQLLELPYTGDDMSLYILLPKQKEGYKQLKTNLTSFQVIESAIQNLREKEVHTTIPKFKIECSYSLPKQLSELGMKQVFTSNADLSRIDGKHDLSVSDVIHKAVVDLNEEGSEAAAATAIVIVRNSSVVHELDPPEFRADHPFVFFIRDNRNGMILFVGHLNKL